MTYLVSSRHMTSIHNWNIWQAVCPRITLCSPKQKGSQTKTCWHARQMNFCFLQEDTKALVGTYNRWQIQKLALQSAIQLLIRQMQGSIAANLQKRKRSRSNIPLKDPLLYLFLERRAFMGELEGRYSVWKCCQLPQSCCWEWLVLGVYHIGPD